MEALLFSTTMISKYKYKRHNAPTIKHNRRTTDKLGNKTPVTQADFFELKKAIDNTLAEIQKKLNAIAKKQKENDPLYI